MSNDLIARLEAATADRQSNLLREAFDALRPEPRKWNGFPWLYSRDEWRGWYRHWRWFEAALRMGAYESAALTLVPEGWLWEWGIDQIAVLTDPQTRRHEIGYHPLCALAICIAALKAKENSNGS